MPNCFSLTRKSEPDAGPIRLIQIDEEMCRHFNVTHDPKLRYGYWCDHIGLSLACGQSFQQIRENYLSEKSKDNDDAYWDRMIEIVEWLNDNFIADAWCQR